MIAFLHIGSGVHVALEHIVALDDTLRTRGCDVYMAGRDEPFDCDAMSAAEIIEQISTALRGPPLPPAFDTPPPTFDAGPSGILPGYADSAE